MVARLRPLLVLVGPTAVGKTALSLSVAQAVGGEVVSADSRLFYRGLDIGTAKPTPAERAQVPHHLIDICAPDETLTLGDYQRRAYAVIDALHQRGRLPILVGGTGQYVWAVVEGWGIPRVSPQPALRQALARLDSAELSRWLARLDPEAAAAIHPNNVRRVIRALEVTLVSGRPISQLQRKSPPPYAVYVVGLACARARLYARADARVDAMLAAGLLDEVMALRAAGYGRTTPAMSGLGYRQLLDYLDGRATLEEAVQRIKHATHGFVRQQQTWFRAEDRRIKWVEVDSAEYPANVLADVQTWLTASSP